MYLAQDLLLDRRCAIKELYSDPLASEAELLAARAQFEREAQALSRLRHKNLPHVGDYFSIDENDYLVMDYIAGESLAHLLARRKRPTEQLLYGWLQQILSALEYCHQNGVIHRDIKPANIILTPTGNVVLVDFGLVKLVDTHNPRTATIVRGLGTPEYTPLEQYDSSIGHTDARSDIYSLGATLYHLLTGRPPQPVSQRILNPRTQPSIRELNPKVSFWMASFVEKAMAIRPENRFQSVSEMRRSLDAHLAKLCAARRTIYARAYRHPPGSDRWQRPENRQAYSWSPVILPMARPVSTLMLLVFLMGIMVVGGLPAILAIGMPLTVVALLYHRFNGGRHNRRSPRI